ncbi:response regulator transcription factor [Caballeronia sp. LZ035]|uniref:response regulator transcription factor n=1 Tax=Caballeronia sp. LZ035 TaxID=3038568 RepID=UPI00286320D1|nr:response regulator transcription factor [Caballeronia sp. LZ035]MDR5761442.1 response regulator transcription factor [Caballeronia sp. LZ035]
MNVIVLTPVRLLGDGLRACFSRRPEITLTAVVKDLTALRDAFGASSADLALIDVTQGIDLYDVRAVAVEWPDVALVALGLAEQRQEVIRCGRAGFSGYVARDCSIDALCIALSDVVVGRLACPAEISGGLLRALFRMDSTPERVVSDQMLTRREGEVLHLIGCGLTNKEIARELCLSVATVKHHVHSILSKLELPGRMHAMRTVREAPWLATSSPKRRQSARSQSKS